MIYVNPTRLSMDSVWLFFGGESADFSALFLRSWKQPKNTRLTRGLGEFFFQIPRDQRIGWLMINLIKIACNFLELSVIFNPQNLWENLL